MKPPIRWGILGAATIAREAVIPALQKPAYRRWSTVAAIASRSLAKAQQVAAQFGIPRAYGSYEELLADPQIDAVYIPLPNHLHVPYAIRALEAGKHVLCEKPIALNAAEAEQLVAASALHPHLKLMEAFMYRHHPQWRWAREMVDGGKLGDLQTIQTFFSFYDDQPESILHHPEWGGGALMDIGCYPISLSRFLFRDEPLRVFGRVEIDATFGVDRMTSGILEFSGGTSTFTCSTRTAPHQRVNVFGNRGRLEIEIPFNAPSDRPCRAWLETDGQTELVEFDICDQYGLQAELFAQAILDNTPAPTPIADAVGNMRVIDALFASGRSGAWVRI